MSVIERLSVVLDTDLRAYSRGMAQAAKEAKNLASEIDKTGSQAQKSAQTASVAFSRLTKAIRETRQEAANGADFKVTVDMSGLTEARSSRVSHSSLDVGGFLFLRCHETEPRYAVKWAII